MVHQSAKSTDFQIKYANSTGFWNILAGCSENEVIITLACRKLLKTYNKMCDSKKQVVANVA